MPKSLRPRVNDRTFVCDADAKCWMEMFNLDQTSVALCNFALHIFTLKSNNKYHQAWHEFNSFMRILEMTPPTVKCKQSSYARAPLVVSCIYKL